MSNDTGNRYAPVVEVVYLTTKHKTSMPTHVFIYSAPKPSIALCEQIVTVCKSRLHKYIGNVSEAEMDKIDRALQTSLGIQKAGGKDMQVTITTDVGEMTFNMEQEKANALMQIALQYATGTMPQTTTHEQTENRAVAVQEEQEQPKTIQPKSVPMSRIERLFGDFRAKPEATQQEAVQEEPTEYKGFLLIKCENCGKMKGFCAKAPISRYKCDCGGSTKLHNLKMAFLHCKCGSNFKYKTNADTEMIEQTCINCGNPVTMQLNGRRNTYVTLD